MSDKLLHRVDVTTPEFGEVNDSRPHIPGLALSCKHKVACLFGYCRYGGVDHCSRNAWQHRGVNDTQTGNAFNAQSFMRQVPTGWWKEFAARRMKSC